MTNNKKHRQTPSQTIGPYFAYGLTPEQYNYRFPSIAHPIMAEENISGEHIIIKGQVFDGEGKTVVDAMLEFRQADSKGTFSKKVTDDFCGFGRVGTGMNDQHFYEVKTIKPKGIKNDAPFINVVIFMRGMLNHQYTRIYFSDEKEKNEQDSILKLVPRTRRKTLIAKRKEMNGIVIYHFDIHIQGKKETVFFDV